MVAKSHCKVHFGDGDDEEEAELEDFYDYSSRFLVFLTTWVLLNSLLTIFIAIYVHMPKLDSFGIIIFLVIVMWMKRANSWLQQVTWTTT